MSIFLVQPGNTWQWRQKPWTTKKNEARKKPRNCTRLHEIRKLGANLFLTIIYLQISRIFRTCWVTHLKFIEWVEKIERTKRTKLVPTILEQNWWKSCWNHSKCSKSSLEKQGMATFRSFSCNFVRSKCHLKSAHESARNWDSWNCPNSWKSGSGAVLFFSKFQRLDAVQKKMLRPKKRWEENSCWSRAAIFSCAGGKSSKKH